MASAECLPLTQDPVRNDLNAIFVSLELSRASWLVTALSPGNGEKMSRHQLRAGDMPGLLEKFSSLQSKCAARTGHHFPVIVIQEAGLDGFWIDRALKKEGVTSYVVDPASITTSRRHRRAKTDGIDGEALVRALLAHLRGEPRVCAMVNAPLPEEEDRRQVGRERRGLVTERVQHVNRIKGLLFTQGITDYEPVRQDRRQRLDTLRTGDGRPLPPHLKQRILREIERLELTLEHLKTVEAERDQLVAEVPKGPPAAPQTLQMLRGVGPEFAMVLWSEGLFRPFANRRQLASYAGLAATPWQSGTVAREQGVSKAGNKRLRTTMIQLSWLWLRHQPQSTLTLWYHERSNAIGSRGRRVMVVALARKLLIALWRFVADGVVPEGAIMNQAR